MKVDFEISLKGLFYLALTLGVLFACGIGINASITYIINMANGVKDTQQDVGSIIGLVASLIGLVVAYYLAKRTYRAFKA